MPINQHFKNRNVLNGLDLDTPIYKYIPLQYIVETLKNNNLYVGLVRKWDDTYENFLIKQNFMYQGMPLSAAGLEDQIYGQCWTTLRESDAMWRIYSDRKKFNTIAIRVKTTARKLFDAIYTDDACMASTYIGRVDYWYNNQVLAWLRGLNITSAQDIGNNIVPSLLIKRKPFKHEEEIRIIVMHDHNMGNGLSYAINPSTFFDEFVIDPLVDPTIEKKIAKRLLNLGVSVNKIKKSTLYTFTPQTIIL